MITYKSLLMSLQKSANEYLQKSTDESTKSLLVNPYRSLLMSLQKSTNEYLQKFVNESTEVY